MAEEDMRGEMSSVNPLDWVCTQWMRWDQQEITGDEFAMRFRHVFMDEISKTSNGETGRKKRKTIPISLSGRTCHQCGRVLHNKSSRMRGICVECDPNRRPRA